MAGEVLETWFKVKMTEIDITMTVVSMYKYGLSMLTTTAKA